MPYSPTVGASNSTLDGLLGSIPGLIPPPGVTAFSYTASRSPLLVAISSVLLGIMIFFLGCRVYTRVFVARKYFWDDLTCAIASLGTIGYCTACIWGVTKGPVGKHQWDVSVSELLSNNFLVPLYISLVLGSPILLFAKLTFFLMYLHIFGPMKWFRYCVYLGAGATIFFYTGSTIVQLVFSTPPPGVSWQEQSTSTREYDEIRLSVPAAAVGLAIDLFILVLPIRAIHDLQLTLKRKIEVGLVFATGILAVVSSILSCVYRVQFNNTNDSTWAVALVDLTIIVEATIGVIVSCMPSFSHMLRHHKIGLNSITQYLTSLLGTRNNSYGSKGSSSKGSSGNMSSRNIFRRDPPPSRVGNPHTAKDEFIQVAGKHMAPRDVEMGHVKTTDTYIRSIRQDSGYNEDGIHLRSEISQTWSEPPTYRYG